MMKNILFFILLFSFTLVGCDPLEKNDENEENTILIPSNNDSPVIIYNDSTLDISISYYLTDDDENPVEETIRSETSYELESGVTEITITGGMF